IQRSDLVRALLKARGGNPSQDGCIEQTSDEGKTGEHSERLPRLNILLVDDNTFNQRVGVLKLEKQGHRVQVAGSGAEALALLGVSQTPEHGPLSAGSGPQPAPPFDVVLMDVQMPDMDGREVTARVRQAEQATGRRLPIIAMTAHALREDQERCLAA